MAWWVQTEHLIATAGILDFIDVAIVSIVIYQLYNMIKDTRALALVKGISVLLLATLLSRWLNLHVIYWLLQNSITIVLVALPVVFQPELRRALERLGRMPLMESGETMRREETQSFIKELANTAGTLSKNNIGALIVLEQSTGLSDYIETGTQIDGKLSSSLLINIFIPNTPLHDGAVIVRGDRIMAAGCLLPLSEDPRISKELGTRHRAGIGLSEQSDAITIIVSEETGTISLTRGGTLTRLTGAESLQVELTRFLALPHERVKGFVRRKIARFFSGKGERKDEK